MKRVLILSVVFAFCLSVNAIAGFGIEGGLNYNSGEITIEDVSADGSGTAFHFGGYYNYPMAGGNYLKLGLGMTTRYWELTYSEEWYGYTINYTMAPEIKSWDIPVLYMIPSPTNDKLTFIVGATIVMENDGDVKYTMSYDGISDSVTDDIDDEDLETDIFVTGGIKYQMGTNIYPEVKLQYNITPDREFYDVEDAEFSYFSVLFSVGLEFE